MSDLEGSISALRESLAPAEIKRIRNIRCPPSQATFLSQLHEVVEEALLDLCAHRVEIAEHDENQITLFVVQRLKGAGYVATREESSNGHVDITVKTGAAPFVWLGEAKKDSKGPQYILGGISQLLERYTSGLQPDCGLVVYCFRENAAARVTNVQKKLSQQKGALKVSSSRTPPEYTGPISKLRVETVHRHLATGTDIRVRHFWVPLYDPARTKAP